MWIVITAVVFFIGGFLFASVLAAASLDDEVKRREDVAKFEGYCAAYQDLKALVNGEKLPPLEDRFKSMN